MNARTTITCSSRPEHAQFCQGIKTQARWGETTCRVSLSGKDTVVRLPAARLRPVHEASVGTVDGIAYLTAAARKIPENVLQEDPKLLMWYDQALTRSGEDG